MPDLSQRPFWYVHSRYPHSLIPPAFQEAVLGCGDSVKRGPATGLGFLIHDLLQSGDRAIFMELRDIVGLG